MSADSAGSIMVQTAVGKQILAEGMIYAHEHLWIDLSGKKEAEGKLDQYADIVEEIRELKEWGVAAIIEQTCIGMGRDITRLRQMQLETGVQILPATGFYHRLFHPEAIKQASVEQIAQMLADELRDGIDRTGIHPMILGEIGGSGPPLYADEIKVFRAVADVARRFPVVITTHAHLGRGGLDELTLLLEGGVAPERVLIGHLDLCPTLDEVLTIAQQGAYVGFDTVGKASYASDQRRVEYIQAFIDAGLVDQILLSCDISRNGYLRQRGGQGYAYLLRVFLPMLEEAGIAPEAIRMMTGENPRRFLAAASL